MKVISLKELDPKFKYEVAEQAEEANFTACFSCGICTARCPINAVDEGYSPRRIIRMVVLGMRKEVLSSDFIWLCSLCDECYIQCPQDVKINDVMKVLRSMAIKGGYVFPPLINEDICSGCGICAAVCPYEAVKIDSEAKVARVDEALCKGCGVCCAACPSGAVQLRGFIRIRERISKTLAAALEE